MVDIKEAKYLFDEAYCNYQLKRITREEYAKAHGAWVDACRQLPSHSCQDCPIGGCPCCVHDVIMLSDEPLCRRCDRERLDSFFTDIKYEKFYFTQGSYKTYRDFPYHKLRAEKIVKMANPKSVLDVGCAYGYIVKHLLDMGVDAYGVDISRWCEKKAKDIIPGRFKRASADKLPFKDNSFDVLYCEGVLEHVEENKSLKALSEFERVAKQRILQISFDNEVWAAGHINIHDAAWWYEKIPMNTWLYVGMGAINEGEDWVYKG